MSKIKTIHINNFKFFGDCSPIVLDGKNLLLYGENGSGKSSIYNALYTLLEAASKTQDETKKYFVPLTEDTPESLVNIHAPRNAQGDIDSYIEITDDTNKVYRLSLNNVDLCGNEEFRESQRSSDFISYKELFLFQLFRNSELSNLHDVFQRAVIPYLTCSTYEYRGQKLSSLSSLFASYRDIEAIKDNNPKGKRVIYKNGKKYKDYLALERQINLELRELIEYINAQLPSTIQSFGYNFKAFLRYEDQSHKKYDMWLEPIPYKVYLEIDEYNGLPVSIKHPNVFLNEAKMSALAFAIRWAILTRRPDLYSTPKALRVLVLDDLMISLDMGNREKILRFLLSDERARQYQILFMTHDRGLYDFMVHKINQHNIRNEWIEKEMFVCKQEGDTCEIPAIIDGEGDIEYKAKKYFDANKYEISAIYLRKKLEEILYDLLPFELKQRTEGKFLSLQTLWEKVLSFSSHTNMAIDPATIEIFNQSKLLILNPSAHYQRLSMPIYKKELEEAFKLVESLKGIDKVSRKLVVPNDSDFSFIHPIEPYQCTFKLKSKIEFNADDHLYGQMPQCTEIKWSYNGVEFYDFDTGKQNMSHPLMTASPRLNKFISRLCEIDSLHVTTEMFLKNCKTNGVPLISYFGSAEVYEKCIKI